MFFDVMKFKLSLLYNYLVSGSAMFMKLDKEQSCLLHISVRYIWQDLFLRVMCEKLLEIKFLIQMQKDLINLSSNGLGVWLSNEMDAMHQTHPLNEL